MLKIGRNIVFLLFFTVVWILLNEEISVLTVVSGVILSEVTLIFVNRFLTDKNYIDSYSIQTRVMLKYFVVLIYHIYESGISSLVKIVKGEEKVGIYHYRTELTEDMRIGLLANAITSTPGTVTINKKGQELEILHLGEFDRKVIDTFEAILKEKKK